MAPSTNCRWRLTSGVSRCSRCTSRWRGIYVVDGLKNQVFRELLTYMLGDPDTIEPATDLILVSRHLERIADHATNIAEDVIFIVEARDVRHHAAEPGSAGAWC